jgi:hypothetical protein
MQAQVVFLVGVQLDITAPQTIPEEAVAAAPAEAGRKPDQGSGQEVLIQAAEPTRRALVAQRGVCGAVRVESGAAVVLCQ